MAAVQSSLVAYLLKRFPQELSPNPHDDGFVMAWLALADELQLDELREVCMRYFRCEQGPLSVSRCGRCEVYMRYFRGLASTGNLEDMLLERVFPAGSLHLSSSSSSSVVETSSALRRISSLRSISSSGMDTHGGSEGGYGGSGSASRFPLRPSAAGPSTWHQDDYPELHHSLRGLSRGALEELLASLAMACSKKYVNLSRGEAAEASEAKGLPTSPSSSASMADHISTSTP